jgi:DNA repair protein SbcC/Rad50
MMSFSRGSEWRKWDLHVHTKDTNKNDQFTSTTFDDFCNTMFRKALDSNVAVIGITDYFSIENYKKILLYIQNLENNLFFSAEEKEQIRLITLIPNVELRMLPSTGSGRLINIHCLFNPNYISKLDNDFFSAIEFSHGARKYRMNKDDLVNLGKVMGETDDALAHKKGIDNFAVSHSELQKILAENAELRNNTIIVTSNKSTDGASGTQQHFDLFEDEQNSSLDATRQAIYKLTDMIFSSNKSDIEYFLGIKKDSKEEVIKKCGSLKPCIHGSDAHTESKLFIPDNNRHCWIKANPTFEGLKQVIYEPSRVYIGENRPQSALHKLEEVLFNFNENTLWDNDKFCFANFNEPLKFSPYLSCIIGGRGSGKSTLLNLIAEKIGKGNKNFFSKLNDKNVASKVTFIPDVIENIEYLAQNEIEDFAKDSTKFTQTIFERLDKLNNILSLTQNEITSKLKIYENQIDRLLLHSEKIKVLESKKNELNKTEYLLKTFMDGDFNTNYTTMNILLQEKNTRLKWKTNYQNSLQEISEVIRKIEFKFLEKDESPESWTNDNGYKDAQKLLQDELNAILNKYQNLDFQSDVQKLANLEEQISNYKNTIDTYLQERGYSLENLNDLKNALSSLTTVQNEIKELEAEIEQINHDITSFSSVDIDEYIYKFGCDINNEIARINQLFVDISTQYSQNVKEIKVEFTINQNIYDDVYEKFITKLSLHQKSSATLKDYLFQIALHDVLACDSVESFKEKIVYRKTQAYDNLIDIFASELNFEIYKLLIQKSLRDIEKYKILKVLYDNKELENSSFGQRCTAAIVILLSLGNNPIIIDEPEAHLDSSLIANYLVELIKQQKQQRQIIFATHNANFVLNADAELIIKLENTDGITSSVSFAIEDLNHREDLLKLEGGKEAFKKREQKYNI